MHLLSVSNLSFSWGYKSLLNKLSFNLDSGQTIGIAGPNGAGKSTLINIILGLTAQDEGHISCAPRTKIAVVSQEPNFGNALSIGDYLLAEIRPLADAIHQLEEALAHSISESETEKLLVDFGIVQEKFLSAGGYEAESSATSLLARTGLAVSMDQALATLSGGERSILTIVQALVANPDILILDEPGNHLDYIGLAWLESFLGEMDKGILLISHNRYLLDHCADSIIYLEAGRHWIQKGSYSAFRIQRELDLEQERKDYAKREKEIHQLTIYLKNLQHQASQSYNPPPKILWELGVTKRKISDLRAIHDLGLTPLARNIRINLKSEELKGENALEVRNLSLSYGERLVLDNVSFKLHRGDRVALVGINGSGKSSLIRLIRQEASWDNPKIKLVPSMKVGYLSQQTPFPDMRRSLVDEVRSWGPLSVDSAFSLISPFAFPYAELDKPLSALSGGELQRLQLALLTYRHVNFLILDEPSNHLDIPGREALESCLADFKGTMLIVSHDRYFLDSFAQRILHLEDGHINEYAGNFSDFLQANPTSIREVKRSRNSQALDRGQLMEPKLVARAIQESPLPSNQDDLERNIHQLESEIAKSEQTMLSNLETNPSLAARLEEGLASKRQELERLFEKWMAK